jgi:glycosyltransferase involved in cell wall biosynthesis
LRTVLAPIGNIEKNPGISHKTLTFRHFFALQAAHPVRSAVRRGRAEADWLRTRRDGADVAVFHDFHPPPYGGGNQFLLALVGEFERRGLRVETNQISGATPACLYNSFNFDFKRLRRFAREGVRMVHRVDGPVGVYRGFDDGTDARIRAINEELADATILQSQWSLEQHRALDIELRNPVVITNAVDPAIFYPSAQREPLDGRRLRVVASSWSDNPRKGVDILRWLDANIAGSRVTVTFVGQVRARFERIRVVAPVPSRELADLLRAHDAYLATSRDDPCSNALLEALACGLPAVYLRSGGHPELVRDAGIAFADTSELPEIFERLRTELDERRAAISTPTLADVADRYLDVLSG